MAASVSLKVNSSSFWSSSQWLYMISRIRSLSGAVMDPVRNLTTYRYAIVGPLSCLGEGIQNAVADGVLVTCTYSAPGNLTLDTGQALTMSYDEEMRLMRTVYHLDGSGSTQLYYQAHEGAPVEQRCCGPTRPVNNWLWLRMKIFETPPSMRPERRGSC